jgi:hypothetical protein
MSAGSMESPCLLCQQASKEFTCHVLVYTRRITLLLFGILTLGLPARPSGRLTEMMVPEVLNGKAFRDVGWKLVVRVLTGFEIEDREPEILCQRKLSS